MWTPSHSGYSGDELLLALLLAKIDQKGIPVEKFVHRGPIKGWCIFPEHHQIFDLPNNWTWHGTGYNDYIRTMSLPLDLEKIKELNYQLELIPEDPLHYQHPLSSQFDNTGKIFCQSRMKTITMLTEKIIAVVGKLSIILINTQFIRP